MSGESEHVPSHEVGHARLVETSAEHQNRPDRDDGRVAEPAQRLLVGDQARDRQGQEHEEPDHVVPHPLRDEEEDGQRNDSQNDQDRYGHER